VNRFLCVRPTLIYGRDDPHNGYGPNRFIRQIRSQNFIEVVGDGEELRDHIYVGDVANLFYMLYVGGNSGFFNLCTGKESSFRSLANETLRISESAKLVNLVRFGPIPHNGYRALDNSALLTVFPDYKFLKYSDFVDRMIKESGLTNGY
jgi:nucleoside-diphosphate-sugar epimerase